MADNTVIVQGYSREALQQLENMFRAAGAGSARDATSSSNTNAVEDNTNAVEDNTESVGTLTKAQRNLAASFANFRNLIGGRGMNMLLGEFKSGLAGGIEAMGAQGDAIGTVEDYLNRTIDSFGRLGISLEELNNFNTVSRAAAINLGGLSAWTDRLASQQEEYYARTGSTVEAVKHQTEMMNLLIHSGAQAADLYDTFGSRLKSTNDELLKMGVTYEESRRYLQTMIQDEDVRQRLMSTANEQQRRQIMLEVQERFKHLKMLGMSTEQAEAASKALEALSGKGPLARIKEAARMQAGMAALGIENAEEVARIYRKGDRATEEEREVVRAALAQMQEIQAESRRDTLGRELTVEAIATRTGLSELPKVFSAKLDQGAKIEQAQLNHIARIGENSENFVKIAKGIDSINNFLEKSWIVESPTMLKDFVKGTAAMAAAAPTIATAATAAAASYDAYQAATTGESASWNALSNTFPEATQTFSDGVGVFVDSILGFTGNKEAKQRLKLLEESRRSDEEQKRDREQAIRETENLRKAIERNNESMDAFRQEMQRSNSEVATTLKKQLQTLEEQNVKLTEELEYQAKIAKGASPLTTPRKGYQ